MRIHVVYILCSILSMRKAIKLRCYVLLNSFLNISTVSAVVMCYFHDHRSYLRKNKKFKNDVYKFDVEWCHCECYTA